MHVRPVRKRPLVNDPVHGSPVVTQVINRVLRDGRSRLPSVLFMALLQASKKTGQEASPCANALDNIRPSLSSLPPCWWRDLPG